MAKGLQNVKLLVSWGPFYEPFSAFLEQFLDVSVGMKIERKDEGNSEPFNML